MKWVDNFEMSMSGLKLLGVCVVATFIAACGSAPKTAMPGKVDNQQPVEQDIPVLAEDPPYYLAQARNAALQQDRQSRDQWILRAAEAYKQQDNCKQSRKIIHLAQPQLSEPRLITQADIILAECILADQPVDFAALTEQLANIKSSNEYERRIGRLKIALLVEQKRWLDAAKSVLMTQKFDQQSALDVWYLLQNLNEKELELARLREPSLQAWIQLSVITQRFGLDQMQLQEAIAEWQQRFADHPLSSQLPQELVLAMQQPAVVMDKVAVLLPLSGRLSQQGIAIKEGVLAAYFDYLKSATTQPHLQFIDTATHSVTQLVEMTSDNDLVIGPLLKETLTDYLALAPEKLNVIGLNQVDFAPSSALDAIDDAEVTESFQSTDTDDNSGDNQANNVIAAQVNSQAIDSPTDVTPTQPEVVPGERVYFALSPEDEAVQLAQIVHRRGAEYPVVISHQNGATRRMADTFMQTWQQLEGINARAPGVATFSDNESMRTSLTSLLDVAQSKSRINQIEYLSSEQIQSIPRNRRDVDSIVLFATPEQTELLNPIIESSLSPFNDKIVPVYASSRSYSLNLSNNSLRDLRNMTFTDMPWMLPEHPWQQLDQQVTRIWPDRDDTLRRLFALGYDAFSLAPVITNLKALPQVSIKGMTGRLSIDATGTVHRALPMGQIAENRVILVAMD